jgi:uncharacterized protein YbjT (DUF2867 family)
MTVRSNSVLVVGATGSIGRLVVEESIRQGYATRALVRNPEKARRLPPEADIVVGDVTQPETLSPASTPSYSPSVQAAQARSARRPSTTAAYATS